MKKIKIAIITILVLIILASISVQGANNKNYEKKVVSIEKWYHEDGDYCSMELKTEDGKVYIINDFICPLDAKCTITFNRKGEIIKITAISKF